MRILAAFSVVLLAGCEGANLPFMGGVSGRVPVVPPVTGYLGGEEILFIHTEASDRAIADTLTAMTGSPVPVVPSLARVPPEATANVFVFTNGVQPDGARGPLEYQPDVFDCPVDTDCYRPLRTVNLVTWSDPAAARVLRSAAGVRRAEAAGELGIERTGVVVNMPLLTWPGGNR
ncbi:MAG: hypothetical protein GWN71_31185 [Gammaproteobacteria bacterium]|nr:hypothetical protein [Gammaproteobacteria bacterium]